MQTHSSVNLSGQISLSGATFGDFGVYQSSLVISAESNNWDFVMRLTYGSSGGVATVLAASPASDGLSASPEGVAVDSQGTVLTTLPYVPRVPTRRSTFLSASASSYDSGGTPAPFVPTLGLTSAVDIDAAAITVDSQNNFILNVSTRRSTAVGPGSRTSTPRSRPSSPIPRPTRQEFRPELPTRTWGERIISRSPTRPRIRTR